MHILVTNDDGPPSVGSSPYVHSLVRALQKAGHTISVCLPAAQRSWIGKAHMIGQTVKPTYYRPPTVFDPRPAAASTPQGSTHTRPSRSKGEEEWILADGTPASCAQLGLYHFFPDKGPVDLVVSGPNYGRNTTAVFALSSGTLGGALEAAACRRKAIALSYAFQSRNHDPAIIEGASAHSVKVIEKLYAQWPADGSVDLYSVNVPLVEGVGGNKTLFTNMLQNYWQEGSTCFQEVEGSVGDEDEEESRIREGESQPKSEGEADGDAKVSGYTHKHYKWAPAFHDVYKSVEQSKPGNDGWAVQQGFSSVTPMKANFWHASTHLLGEELKLDSSKPESSTDIPHEMTLSHRPKNHFYALVDYDDPYVQPLVLSALEKVFPSERYTLLPPPTQEAECTQSEVSLASLLPSPEARVLQVTSYEAVDWEYVSEHKDTCLVNSYMLRKALIRKHYLAATVEGWVAKRPGSVLEDHVKRSEAFELDYAEFLDDALVEAFELRASLERNGGEGEDGKEPKDREWWILKPGMSDRGQGIRLFSTMEDLQGIFDEWEAELPDSEDEDENEVSEAAQPHDDDEERDYITTSHLRHFVAQPYIHPPLLLPGDSRKFHIRTYVLCVGILDVYVYREMLALFAGKPYVAPWEDGGEDLEAHLTNTCLQRSVTDGTVRKFWDIDLPSASSTTNSPSKDRIFDQICSITGDVFEAATRGMMMHFQPLPNAFEVYGVDFLVDAKGTAWLLEINAFPDFKQTGDELQGLVAELWECVLSLSVGRFFPDQMRAGSDAARSKEDGEISSDAQNMVHVRNVDLGRRWGPA
ncbi:5'/3'-nucleotidase sure [Xylariales sp. AK1849]|nr:5'/3'-nucleotidase sure [Xylariales sp. AK1849]